MASEANCAHNKRACYLVVSKVVGNVKPPNIRKESDECNLADVRVSFHNGIYRRVKQRCVCVAIFLTVDMIGFKESEV